MSDSTTEAPTTFVYEAKSGDSITLAAFHLVPTGVFRKARALSPMDQMFAVIEAAVDEENLEKVDALPVAEVHVLFSDWTDGATVPNS